MIQFFCGRNGSGKTYRIYQQLKAEKDLKKVVLIVPDQSSFQNEKRILNEFGASKAAEISVFGFERLYDHLSEKYGENTKKKVDDGAKGVLMSLAAEAVSDKLDLYADRSRKADFAEMILSIVEEYKICAITPEKLMETVEKISGEHLKEKIKESALIYSAYDAILNEAYSDPSDDLTRLYSILCEHEFFMDRRVYIDSFNGFSGQEYKILEKIIEQAEYVGISLGFDGMTLKNAENSMFKEPYMTMKRILKFADDNNIEIMPTVHLNSHYRFKNPSLSALEESIFRFDGDVYDNDDNAVKLYEAENEYDEIKRVAGGICQLVRKDGLSYNDITVICRDIGRYKHIIESEFPKYDIPFFMSDKRSLEGNSLIRLILSAFDIVHSSFSTESILTFLKTELTDISSEEVCILENYAYMWDIRGKRWTEEFTMNPNGNEMSDGRKQEASDTELQEIEAIRKRAISPMMSFSENVANARSGGDISKSVYKLLQDVKAEEKLYYIIKWFHDSGNIKAQEAEIRVWNITMEILDRMYNILLNKKIDSRRYAELLEMMIRKSPISDIPQTLDQVTIGIAGNLISENPKAVFVIGAMEGVFPAMSSAVGFFSDSERSELIKSELPLHNALYDMSLLEKYNVYSALSLPSEKLFISCHTADFKGEKFKPSVIFDEVKSILNNVNITRRNMLSAEEIYFTERQGFEECASKWNDNTCESETLKEYFLSSENFKDMCVSIDRAIKDEPYKIYDKKKAKQLFGEKIHLSASQAEIYYSCPFAYFCKYGLKVYPRKRAVMDAGMYGSVVHYVLENLLKEETFENISQYSDDQLSAVVEKHINNYIEAIGGKDERLERFMAQFGIMERNLVIVLKRLIDEFSVSSFVPESFELKIGGENQDIPEYELELPGGEKIYVTGKIDRVDTYKKGNEKYIRIVDYKTGQKSFKLSEVYYGLNMQMLLYLSAIKKNGKEKYSENGKYKFAPAGILYMPSTPQSSAKAFNSEKNRAKNSEDQRKNFKMSGLLIKDEEVLAAMEKDIAGIYIPASKNLDKCQNLVSLEEYGKIFSYIDKQFIKMAANLFDGNIERNPVKKSSFDACEYCDYKKVCGYEKGKKTNMILELDNEEILKKMEDTDDE